MQNNNVDVVIATPGSSMDSAYVQSLVETMEALTANGISFMYSNEYATGVAAAREATAMGSTYLSAFENRPFSGSVFYKKMFWIDSDMSWKPKDFLKLYEYDLDIISGLYFNNKGVPMFGPLNEEDDVSNIILTSDLKEIGYAGFGFICVSYGVFESMPRPWFSEKFYKIKDQHSSQEKYVPYGEDYSWCLSARECGHKIYLDPTVRLTHHKKVPIYL